MAQKHLYADYHLHKNQLIEARYENSPTAPTSPQPGQVYFDTATNKFMGWNGTAWIDLSQVVSNTTQIMGDITNANTNPTFPASPSTGDIWFITTTSGTVGGLDVEPGDQLIRGTSGWFVLQSNLKPATEALAGYIRLATQAEANAGALDNVVITPLKLANFLVNALYARKVVINVASLSANTPTTVTHGLNVLNQNDLIVNCWQAGEIIDLRVVSSTVNAIQIESNIALSNVRVVMQG